MLSFLTQTLFSKRYDKLDNVNLDKSKSEKCLSYERFRVMSVGCYLNKNKLQLV